MLKIIQKDLKAWVTFSYEPKEDVSCVAVAGDWNGWEPEEMKCKKDGTFYLRKYLPLGSNYHFRYWVDDKRWANDFDALKVGNPFGTQNSLLELEIN